MKKVALNFDADGVIPQDIVKTMSDDLRHLLDDYTLESFSRWDALLILLPVDL